MRVDRLRIIFCLVIFLGFLISPGFAFAQETPGPVYIVQEGDSLWDIAVRFRVSMEELARINGITDPAQLTVGMRLVIPGLEGIEGILTTKTISFGDSLESLSRQYRISEDTLVKLNHITSPRDLYVGSNLVIPVSDSSSGFVPQRAALSTTQSIFELAVAKRVNPWSLVLENDLAGNWDAVPGDVLFYFVEGVSTEPGPGALPEWIQAVELKPTRFAQGKVAEILVEGDPEITLSGEFLGHELHFFSQGESEFVSLQGIHAMTEPGVYTLSLSGEMQGDGEFAPTSFSFIQTVLVGSGNYPFDPVLTVSPETIDPAVTRPEDAQWAALADLYTPEKLWSGQFISPAPEPFSDCWPSRFGNRRSYNGSAYIYFHTGLDFCGGVGVDILAPAAGIVVFAGPLTVRGNATMIDHGWGVLTGYMHQSEILVQVGDRVEQGQRIGLVGGTGRVTGPHLHWEVWAGGVQVDPLEWLEKVFP